MPKVEIFVQWNCNNSKFRISKLSFPALEIENQSMSIDSSRRLQLVKPFFHLLNQQQSVLKPVSQGDGGRLSNNYDANKL